MLIGVQSSTNYDIGFVVEVNEQIDKAMELIRHGFECWIRFSCTEFPTEYFSEDEADWIECAGYAEPSLELLDRFNIPHSDAYSCFDEEGELVSPWNGEVEIVWVY